MLTLPETKNAMSEPIALPTAQSAQPAKLPTSRRKLAHNSKTGAGNQKASATFSPLTAHSAQPASLAQIMRSAHASTGQPLVRDDGWTQARQAKAKELIRSIENLVDSILAAYSRALAEGKVKPESLPLAAGILLSKRDGLQIELGNVAIAQANRMLAPSDVLTALRTLAQGAQSVTVAQSASITAHNVGCVASEQVLADQPLAKVEAGGGGSSSARE